ncbi:hypothetical protein GQX74_005412 [Glossina fuscipes]|nr:hypothetical protein GQX74_005412 [Glossina fuscipes]
MDIHIFCTSLLHPPSNDGERMQPKFISNNHKYALKAQNYKSSHLLNKINNTIEQLKSLRAVCMSMSMIMTMMIIIGIKFHNATIKSMNRLLLRIVLKKLLLAFAHLEQLEPQDPPIDDSHHTSITRNRTNFLHYEASSLHHEYLHISYLS